MAASAAVAAVRQRDVGGGGSTTARCWLQLGGGSISGCGGSAKCGGGAQSNGGSGVAEARMLWRWRQHDSAMLVAAWRRGGGDVFVLGQGLRDNGADGIVIVGNGGVHGNVHRGHQYAATADSNAADDNTANGDSDANDIVC